MFHSRMCSFNAQLVLLPSSVLVNACFIWREEEKEEVKKEVQEGEGE